MSRTPPAPVDISNTVSLAPEAAVAFTMGETQSTCKWEQGYGAKYTWCSLNKCCSLVSVLGVHPSLPRNASNSKIQTSPRTIQENRQSSLMHSMHVAVSVRLRRRGVSAGAAQFRSAGRRQAAGHG